MARYHKNNQQGRSLRLVCTRTNAFLGASLLSPLGIESASGNFASAAVASNASVRKFYSRCLPHFAINVSTTCSSHWDRASGGKVCCAFCFFWTTLTVAANSCFIYICGRCRKHSFEPARDYQIGYRNSPMSSFVHAAFPVAIGQVQVAVSAVS